MPASAASGAADARPSRPRAAWVDAARGIGIILVVYGHVLRGVTTAGLMAGSILTALEDRVIYGFHMPLFFLLSGLFLERSLSRGKRAFVADKLWTILYPYLLWSVVQGVLQVELQGSGVNLVTHWSDLLRIAWSPLAEFWFLYALFFSQLVICALLPRLWLLVILSAACFVIISAFPSPEIWATTLTSFPVVVLGVVLGRTSLLRREIPTRIAIAAAIGCWTAFALILCFFPNGPWTAVHFARFYLLAAAGSGGTMAIARLVQLSHLLRTLGRASMAIYLLHTLFAAAVRISLHRLLPNIDGVAHLLLGTGVGLLVPTLIWRATEGRGAAAWLGFSRPLDRARAPAALNV